MRIGISGGTFDPVHNAHLASAIAVREKLSLDKVIFIPSGNPPHKKEMDVTSPEHRYLMLQRAVEQIPHFEVSRIEIDREGLTYTIDTLKEFKIKYGSHSKLIFITGADVIHDILTWKDFKAVFAMCEFAATLRPGYDKEGFLSDIDYLRQEFKAAINMVEIPQMDISSTMIRERVFKGLSIEDLVPESVGNYIKLNNLYKDMNFNHIKPAELK